MPCYPEIFRNIDNPEHERSLAGVAKYLFDTAYDINHQDYSMHQNLLRLNDSPEVSQGFWEYKNNQTGTYDQMVISMMRRGIIIAIEHRIVNDRSQSFRASLAIYDSTSTMYTSDLAMTAHLDVGASSAEDLDAFQKKFFITTAQLGLQTHAIQRLSHQNDNSSATLASAA
ncbi:hypothetical protein H7200_00690 [Candidatus Saccharibacteria bacterium]|nr:hypothetical protein [Candidatus Saccharibacteria bacterium]